MGQVISRGPAQPHCLICGGQRHVPIFNEFGIDILRCRECRHVFSAFPADPHYEGFWGEEVPDSEHFYWQTARSPMYEDFFRRFLTERSGRLLDMGSGLGFFLKAAAAHRSWEVYGCEISPAAVKYATERLGLTNISRTRLQDADLPPNFFDIITMWDVLDHIAQPDSVLTHCHTLLKRGGVCFIRVPNISVQLWRARLKKLFYGIRDGENYLQAKNHPHHYATSTIRRLFERNGFSRVQFVHLKPVQGPTGRPTALSVAFKAVCFEVVRSLAFLSAGRLNFDNLFVVAHKES